MAHDLLVGAGLVPVDAPVGTVNRDAKGSDDAARAPLESNTDRTASGWAASHSAGLLDVWSDSDPQIGFVLVYASPQYALADSLRGRAASLDDVEQVVGGWLSCNDELLRFYNRHADCCVLVDVASVSFAPGRFVAHVSQVLGLPLKADAATKELQPNIASELAIACTLAQALVEGHGAAAALQLELASQASLDPAECRVAQVARLEAWQQYVNLLSGRDQQSALVAELQARLEQNELATRELCAQLADRDILLQQVRLQADALTQEIATLRAERDRQPDTPLGPTLVTELTQENELLLLQLHAVQEELEYYFLQHRDIAAQAEADAPLLAFVRQQWIDNQPNNVVLDLRRTVAGSNWHDIEADGRWAGPAAVSSLLVPALRSGLYSIQLDVADAMAVDILLGMELLLNGVAMETETVFDGFPALILASVAMQTDDRPIWELQLRFPRVMAPRERGEDDDRMLAIRLRTVTLTWLEPV